jgi:hypothetical protein
MVVKLPTGPPSPHVLSHALSSVGGMLGAAVVLVAAAMSPRLLPVHPADDAATLWRRRAAHALARVSRARRVALAGYALVGIGVASAVPTLYAAATRLPGVSRAQGIAAVSSIGCIGFMLGPPLVGAVAKAVSFGAAMGVVVVASALLVLLARHVPQADRAAHDHGQSITGALAGAPSLASSTKTADRSSCRYDACSLHSKEEPTP